MPEVLDLSKETDATLDLYGLERGSTKGFAWQCLMARRLVERGVRFVELIDTGSSNNWDSHADMKQHAPLAKNVDQPHRRTAARPQEPRHAGRHAGRLDDRVRPHPQHRRPHRPQPLHSDCYSSWLAGAGVKGGIVYGKSDDYGAKPVEDPVHVHDFHATILHLLGFDHERLTFRHAGRDFRLTDVSGRRGEGNPGVAGSPAPHSSGRTSCRRWCRTGNPSRSVGVNLVFTLPPFARYVGTKTFACTVIGVSFLPPLPVLRGRAGWGSSLPEWPPP